MRTLLLNPPAWEDFDGGAGSRYQARREVWSFWYPTWLCYPAGLVPGSRVLDAPPHGLTRAGVVDIARSYDLVVLYTSAPSFAADVRTAACIKDANPGATVVFVGAHATARAEEILAAAPWVDVVARREFDFAVRDLASGRDPVTIPGVSCRRGGRIVHTADPPPLTAEQLDGLPFVTGIYARDLDYLKYNSPYCRYPYVSLYTGRGCPARCTFCLWPQVMTGHTYRARSPENVVEEVRGIPRLFPRVQEIFFDDDTFTADAPRARRIAGLLRPLGLCWSTNARATVDRETLRAMKEGGLRLLVVGYESGNEQILRNIRKGVSLERMRRFTRDCHDLGILIHGTFILGLPGETRETIAETIRFAREMNPATVQVSLASPYPGTHLYEELQAQGVLAGDAYSDPAGYQRCLVSYPGLPAEEIFAAVERFYRKFYFRPAYVLGAVRKMAADREERRRMLREAGEFFAAMYRRRAGARPGAPASPPQA